ncbi:MAG TPA: tripartite tricarboxylate transporter substrate binding protein [Alphaproteobacteria bacterium]|nr:tripartite tricarboxylate transporter substrate binding protein [Alphaproteobacteria bacterium]
MTARSFRRVLGAAAILLAAGSAARADNDDARTYPNRPIHLVAPVAAGGANDVLARLIADKLGSRLGQPVVTENRAGAATIIGTAYVAHAAPNGYTLLIGPMAALAVNPAIYETLPYNPRDLVPISLIATYPLIMVVNKDAPVRSVRELVTYAKANPSKVNSGGAAGTFQLATELFKQRTGAPIEYLAYKGSNETVAAIMSGELTMAMVDAGAVSAQVKADTVRGLAVTAPARIAAFPDLPTMAEAGLPDMVVLSWSGIFAPAGTPPTIVKKLQDEIIRAVKSPDVSAKLRALDLDPVGNTGDEFQRIVDADIRTWAAVAATAHIRLKP